MVASAFDISFTVSGKIWKVKVNEQSGDLVFELRDVERKDVFFLLFYWEHQEVSDYFHIPGAGWWSTLATFEGNYVHLDYYPDPMNPGSRATIVHELSHSRPHLKTASIYYPAVYWQGSADFDMIKDFVGKEIVLGVEYFEAQETAAFSYYLPLAVGFSRHMVVLRGEKELCHLRMEDSVLGFAEGAFMIINKTVVFITNSNQFNGIHL